LLTPARAGSFFDPKLPCMTSYADGRVRRRGSGHSLPSGQTAREILMQT
jgi:hypothetical protein